MTADTLRSELDRLDDQIEVAALAGSPRQVARLERRRADVADALADIVTAE